MKTKLLLVSISLFLLSHTATFAQQEGFIGEVKMFAGNFAPRGWAICDGSILSIAQNTALFSILGTTYGGDGRTTFALPDLRSRVPVGTGTGPGLSEFRLGSKAGSETVTLSVNQLPAHNHTINAVSTDGNKSNPSGYLPASTKLLDPEYSDASADVQMASSMVGNTGGNQAVNINQPSLTINFIICVQGVFPSRN
ncbi:MAG: phage tail protein [Bacteroidales bacterium]|nr:phage tail protein [Bacteroidales bacterium]